MQLRRRARGFLLVEVLVALLLAGLAVVALAAAHAAALRGTRLALNQAVAMQLLTDLAERLRANPAGVMPEGEAGSPYQLSLSWAAQQSQEPDALADACDGPGAACSAPQFARADLAQWRQLLWRSLPSGAAFVQVDAPTRQADVWVAWSEPGMLHHEQASHPQDECPPGLGAAPALGLRCLHVRVAW